MRIPVIRGRGFSVDDGPTGPPVIVISRELARQYLSDRDPIGQRIHFGGPRSTNPWMTIVGVVGDVLAERLDAPPRATMYRPLTQASSLSMGMVVRSSGDLSRLEQVMGETVRGADPDLPVYAVRTMAAIEAGASASRRFSMRMLGAFALLALTLAAIGIYGVMAHLVSQRTREIGIRMALGARPGAVVGMVVVQAIKLAGAGVLLGLVGGVHGHRDDGWNALSGQPDRSDDVRGHRCADDHHRSRRRSHPRTACCTRRSYCRASNRVGSFDN